MWLDPIFLRRDLNRFGPGAAIEPVEDIAEALRSSLPDRRDTTRKVIWR